MHHHCITGAPWALPAAPGYSQTRASQHNIARPIATLAECLQIADELGLHMMIGSKGASGYKPCALCANVVNRDEKRCAVAKAAALGDDVPLAVPISEGDGSKLMPMTPELLRAVVARLSDGFRELNKGDFKELQTRLGWTWDAGLPRRICRAPPTQVVCYDWQHVLFVNGVFNTHLGVLMIYLSSVGITYKALHTYCSQYCWPGRVGSPAEALNEKRARSSWDACVFKASASEGLGLMPVCRMLCAPHRQPREAHMFPISA